MAINLHDLTGQESGIIPEKPYEEDPIRIRKGEARRGI